MNQDIVKEKDQRLHVDTNNDRPRDGSFSSILKARDNTKSYVRTESENLKDTATAMGQLNANLEAFIKSLQDADAEVKKTQSYKEFMKTFRDFSDSFNDARAIVRKGSTDMKTLATNAEKCNNAYDAMAVSFNEMSSVYDSESKGLKNLSKEKKKQLEMDKADLRLRQEIRKQQKQRILEEQKEGNKSAIKAFQQGAGKLAKILEGLDIRNSLDKIANSTGMSDSARTQLEMMNTYGLSKAEFNNFKKSLYNQIDTGIYTSKDVKSAIASLQEIGINNIESATDKFNTIIKGQQLLGMTAQQQAKLQAIGNRTGRDYLTFTTNKMAKILTESNNISKKQLAELIDLNANFISDFADMGISSEAMEDATASATGFLTNLMGNSNLANKYTSILTALGQTEDSAGAGIGMGLDEFYKQLESGTTLGSMVMRGQGAMGQLYTGLMNGTVDRQAMTNLVNQGTVTAAQRDYLMAMSSYDKQNGAGAFARAESSFKGVASGEALDSIEQNTKDGTSFLSEITNNFTNWVSKSFDWVDFSSFETSMKIITTLLSIIAASEVISDIGSLFKGLGKGASKLGGSSLVKGLAGSKAMSWMGTGGAGAGLTTAGAIAGGALLAGGAIWGGIDAYNNVKQSDALYGKGHKVGAGVSGFIGGSGVKRDAEGNISSGKTIGSSALSGAGKGALIGAGIGTFIGGPVGTLVGGAIGAGVGAIGGALSGWWKSSKAKEQEARQKEQLEQEKAIAENTAATKELLSKSGNAVTLVARKTYAARSYTGEGAYHPSARAISGGTGVGASYPWGINSGFGARTLPNGDQNGHNGVDWAVSEGTPIGAPISGRVTYTQQDDRNTYYNSYGLSYSQRVNAGSGVTMLGEDGRYYNFWHLSKVGVKTGDVLKAGDLIGLSGNTGYSTGAHLHYGVKENGLWVDPIANNLVGAGLFAASGATVLSTDTSSSAQDTSLEYSRDYPSQKVFTNKIRRFSSFGSTGVGAVVDGLAAIRQTLIDLSNRQTQDEQILSMLQGTRKQDPRTS